MCGIVGAVAERNVSAMLVDGLRRLEYRGYDSAGVSVISKEGKLVTCKRVGKVINVAKALEDEPVKGVVGIAHTRWATHGSPSEKNAHPHTSGDARIAVVHNGIIENYQQIRSELVSKGYVFQSETDTETIVHLVDDFCKTGLSLFDAVKMALTRLEGAYAIGVVSLLEPDKIVAARHGSPLVLGVGYGENFIASDPLALRMITDRFIYLQENDIAIVSVSGVDVFDAHGNACQRPVEQFDGSHDVAEKGEFRHFMLKEIFEQPVVFENAIQGRVGRDYLVEECFGAAAKEKFALARAVQIVACGTSFHAGMVARYWIEAISGLPCHVEVASEFRYRQRAMMPGTLLVTISQSGETADTLAALRGISADLCIGSFAICNVPNSTLARESDFSAMTMAGPEIGVASTKAFTSQLIVLQLLALALARYNNPDAEREKQWVSALHTVPSLAQQVLKQDLVIQEIARLFVEKNSTFFLGRGEMYPLALEGALKLKEISYIHAEGYPAGELKHGPLALVDKHMPVVSLLPSGVMFEKTVSNLQEVHARDGQLVLVTDASAPAGLSDALVIPMPAMPESVLPILYAIPLQLLSYHVAVMRGTDVDQPRNLAKSVTVE